MFTPYINGAILTKRYYRWWDREMDEKERGGSGGLTKTYKGEDCYRRGGSKLQSIFTLWPCYMVRKTAEGISTYKVELIKFIVLLFQQKR